MHISSFSFNATAPTDTDTLSLHDALPISTWEADIQLENGAVRAGTLDSETIAPTIFNTGQVLFGWRRAWLETRDSRFRDAARSEEHTSELQSRGHLVCRLLLEKKNKTRTT